jgi:NAD-dependent dihydropyrimidine dehydrogenase PreA subunit
MTYVITEKCVGICDTACVDVCPADCIRGPVELDRVRAVPPAERGTRFEGLQLYVDPESCIGCAACEPVCPAEAIFEDCDVPAESSAAVAANATFFERGAPRSG